MVGRPAFSMGFPELGPTRADSGQEGPPDANPSPDTRRVTPSAPPPFLQWETGRLYMLWNNLRALEKSLTLAYNFPTRWDFRVEVLLEPVSIDARIRATSANIEWLPAPPPGGRAGGSAVKTEKEMETCEQDRAVTSSCLWHLLFSQ
jgi:hypothetical protein